MFLNFVFLFFFSFIVVEKRGWFGDPLFIFLSWVSIFFFVVCGLEDERCVLCLIVFG